MFRLNFLQKLLKKSRILKFKFQFEKRSNLIRLKEEKRSMYFFYPPRVMHFSLENFFWRFLSHIKSTSLSRVSMKVLLTRGKRIKYHPTLTYITFVRQKLLCTHREPYSYKPAATLFACLLHKHFSCHYLCLENSL